MPPVRYVRTVYAILVEKFFVKKELAIFYVVSIMDGMDIVDIRLKQSTFFVMYYLLSQTIVKILGHPQIFALHLP